MNRTAPGLQDAKHEHIHVTNLWCRSGISGGGQMMSAPCAHLVGLACSCWSLGRVDDDFRRVQKKPLNRRGSLLHLYAK